MRRIIASVVVSFFLALSAQAQDEYPSAEIFGGFSYLNADAFDRDSLYGWGVSVAGNLSKYFGIVAEASGHYGNRRVPERRITLPGFPGEIILPGFNLETDMHTFLVGPRLSARGDHITAFGHFLVGGTRRTTSFGLRIATFPGFVNSFSSVSDTGFTMAAGGGLDIKAGRNVAVRLFEADYLPMRFNYDWTHNFRIQSGVVFRFGDD